MLTNLINSEFVNKTEVTLLIRIASKFRFKI